MKALERGILAAFQRHRTFPASSSYPSQCFLGGNPSENPLRKRGESSRRGRVFSHPQPSSLENRPQNQPVLSATLTKKRNRIEHEEAPTPSRIPPLGFGHRPLALRHSPSTPASVVVMPGDAWSSSRRVRSAFSTDLRIARVRALGHGSSSPLPPREARRASSSSKAIRAARRRE